jgi:hypothetical protein
MIERNCVHPCSHIAGGKEEELNRVGNKWSMMRKKNIGEKK